MTMKSNPLGMHLARRIDSKPMLMDKAFLPSLEGLIEKADAFYALGQDEIDARYEKTKAMMLQAYGLPVEAFSSSGGNGRSAKSFAYANGTAIIPIHGSLVNRCNDTACGTMTGYNMIQSSLAEAMADNDVERILFDVDSGGGEVPGCAETASMIRDAGAVKPTMAFVDSSCYSAAYWLASAANKLVSIPSGGIGSIGALIAHADYSQQLENEGVKITFVSAGKEKVSGNPYEALSDDTRKDWQAQVDKMRERFADAVAANRGIDSSVAMGTEARCYTADDALAIGLVDELSDPINALSLFDAAPRGADSKEKPSDKKAVEVAPKATSHTKPKGEKMDEQELAQAKKEAAEAERTRISAIVDAPEAVGVESLAKHFAFKTSMAADDAVAALVAAAPIAASNAKASEDKKEPAASEQTVSARESFANSMASTGNPGIGAGDGTPQGGSAAQDPEAATAQEIMKSFGMAYGQPKKQQ